MSCGWHGAGTPSEFVCIICDINGLLASACSERWKAEGGLDRLREQLASGGRGASSDDVHGDDAVAFARWQRCSRLRTVLRVSVSLQH
jgi:hypothetical protein